MSIVAPAILTQLATPLGQAVVTRAMTSFGEAAVAGMAIVGRMTPVAFGVILAGVAIVMVPLMLDGKRGGRCRKKPLTGSRGL